MNNSEKFLVLIALVLFAIAIFLPSTTHPTNQTKENSTLIKGKEIIYNAINFGYNKSEYYYVFSENVNGYEQVYTLMKNVNGEYVKIDDKIGTKEIYFVGGKSFLCVQYLDEIKCSETTNLNETPLIRYYASLKSKFFNNNQIEKERTMFDEFFSKGYVVIKKVEETTKYGKKCIAVNYVIDYTNMSVSDATKYGISLDIPKYFEWSICEADGIPFYKEFTYSHKGVEYKNEFLIKEFGKPSQIIVPENLTDDAYSLLVTEMQVQNTFAECFTKTSKQDKEKCISLFAFKIANPSFCLLAGDESDRCIVRLIPYIKDESWCQKVQDSDFKDDCFIEVAGALKNSSYCQNITNAKKIEFCMNVSVQNQSVKVEEEGHSNENQSQSNSSINTSKTNSSDHPEIIKRILDEIENSSKSEEK
ncbi:MAG: hypothetical protein QXF35_03195 [Candidatus Bilamarchaeaceae archaeon]